MGRTRDVPRRAVVREANPWHSQYHAVPILRIAVLIYAKTSSDNASIGARSTTHSVLGVMPAAADSSRPNAATARRAAHNRRHPSARRPHLVAPWCRWAGSWFFKIDDEFGGRGIATFDTEHLPSHEVRARI